VSSLIVQVCKVDAVEPHPNADRMDICVIKGWRTCTAKGQFKADDLCVYIPPDSVLSDDLANRLGVSKYLAALPKDHEGKRPPGGRIRVARLRGEKSYGLVIKPDDSTWPLGQDVAQILGVAKFDPPQPSTDGDAERPHPAFFRYTDIENYRNFPDILKEGEEVVFTEKLHGKNTRLALIKDVGDDGTPTFVWMAGSHDVRRKEYMTIKKIIKDEVTKEPILDDKGEVQSRIETRRSQFWDCLTDNVKDLMRAASEGKHNVILYGEMLGQGIQDMTYGMKFGFRAFDLNVAGKYVDYDMKKALFDRFEVPMVPVLYRGPFSKAKLEEFVDGPTTMCEPDRAGAFKGREGIVITPVKERLDFDLHDDGRVILKAVSFAYLERAGGTEFH
jgi:RNA ligase (TIGR02306 family)